MKSASAGNVILVQTQVNCPRKDASDMIERVSDNPELRQEG